MRRPEGWQGSGNGLAIRRQALAESRVSALSLGYASLVRQRFRDDREQQSLVLWGMWLLTMGVFYSVAGFFHALGPVNVCSGNCGGALRYSGWW